jgi:hypothetical protein
MLIFLTLGVMGAIAYASLREGLLTALSTLVNVVLAGLVAFNFFEPLANQFEDLFRGSFLVGYEDALSLTALFALTLGLLRVLTNNLASSDQDLPALLQQVATGAVSLVTGYLVAGFLVCVFQTLPLEEKFLGFEYQQEPSVPNKIRSLIPPDRVWLSLMHQGGKAAFSQEDGAIFDPQGTFSLRYAKKRRTPSS